MRHSWIIAMLVVGGCVSTSPVIPPRWQLTLPEGADAAAPGTVYLGRVYGSYKQVLCAMTNTLHVDPTSVAYVDLATNRLPVRRFNFDLSVDGGSNWTRRIGYGVQSTADRIECEFVWSPPEDYSLMTTAAVVRAVRTDGEPWPVRSPAMPWDLPAGCNPTCFTFPIVGAYISAPAAGSIQWEGEGTLIQWTQLGGGAVWDLYWQTPTSMGIDVMHWITSISNVVTGANSKTLSLNALASESLRLVVVSQADSNLKGYSGYFTVDP